MIPTLWNNLRRLAERKAISPRSYGLTDTGLKRDRNEDAIFFSDRHALYLVADGMGGHDQGEVASSLAVKSIVDHFEKTNSASFVLSQAIEEANLAIYSCPPSEYRSGESPLHMGTTIVACYARNGKVSLAHVGDSRAYRLRQMGLERLTRDHSLVQDEGGPKIGGSRFKNVITRAVGLHPEVIIDSREEKVQEGDLILLCSDGLTRMVDDGEIKNIIGTSSSLETKCQILIAAANHKGGKDNISAILIQF